MDDGQDIGEFITKLARTEKAVIVEGRKDKEALGAGNVFCLNHRPVYKVAEEAAARSRKVVILTDLDREGKKLYGKLRTQLQLLGVEVDNYFREFLLRKTKIRQIEGLRRLSVRELYKSTADRFFFRTFSAFNFSHFCSEIIPPTGRVLKIGLLADSPCTSTIRSTRPPVIKATRKQDQKQKQQYKDADKHTY